MGPTASPGSTRVEETEEVGKGDKAVQDWIKLMLFTLDPEREYPFSFIKKKKKMVFNFIKRKNNSSMPGRGKKC